ncbi:hypothetical protein Glove_264g42 [Diversispora epigaea]|uniref:Uncharacterized protein n=1 Tax=Diversispora epigaea TaxID=1348612 RepID=A0A397IAZ2_9GLOM|nr:hypothetical protein Glove_264g42 [Diversispora epigaea]
MSSAVTKIVKAYKLSPQLSPSELSRYADELTKDLSRTSRDQARRCLRQIDYCEEQVRALIPFQKFGRHTPKVNSIKDMAQSILKNSNLSHMEINEDTSHIAYLEDKEMTTDIVRSSRLSYLRRELCINGVTEEVIDATKDRDITKESNRLQKMRREILTCQKLDPPDYFMPEAILERLQGYCISELPTEQALADIITMLCMRPAEVTTLHITNGFVTGYAKGRGIDKGEPRKFRSMEKDEKQACELLTWIQKAIANGTLQDPGIPGIKWFNSFLKSYGIKPSDLRELGANYTAMIHEPENPGQRLNIMREESQRRTHSGIPSDVVSETSKPKIENSGLDDIMSSYGIKPSDLRELGANYTAMIHEPENPGQRLNIMREESQRRTHSGIPSDVVSETSKPKIENSGLDDIMKLDIPSDSDSNQDSSLSSDEE